MVQIIKDGRLKTFFCKCQKCASDLQYQINDVHREYSGSGQVVVSNSIICPVCMYKNSVFLMTEKIPD